MKIHNVDIDIRINEKGTQASSQTETMLAEAKRLATTAYAPYSRFRVGAVALLDNGQMVSGSNQENAAYPSGLCAERVTVFYANAQYPDAKITDLLIYAETDKGPVSTPITPCGACRQVLIEKEAQQGTPIRVTLAGASDLYEIPGVGKLLPLSFIPDSLNG